MTVTRDLAERLKRLGFDLPVRSYRNDVELWNVVELKNWNTHSNLASAPSLSEVCQWLREKKNIYVHAYPQGREWCWYIWKEVNGIWGFDKRASTFEDYNECLLAGITAALNQIEK